MAEQFDAKKAYLKFWSSFLLRAESRTNLFKGLKPVRRLYLTVHSDWRDILFHTVIKKFNCHVELLIGVEDKDEIDQIFESLYKAKEQIEIDFGDCLEWRPRGDRDRRAQVRKTIYTGGWGDDSNWSKLQDEMIDTMEKLQQAINPHLRNYWM